MSIEPRMKTPPPIHADVKGCRGGKLRLRLLQIEPMRKAGKTKREMLDFFHAHGTRDTFPSEVIDKAAELARSLGVEKKPTGLSSLREEP